ncbi:MAG: di-heme-cytochrome C peroxidase [Bryobacteraceae bacterium]
MQKYFVYLFYKIGTNFQFRAGLIVLLIVIFLLVRSTTLFDRAYYTVADNDPDRGAATVSSDIFGDQFKTVKYLDQGWDATDSLWFYTTTQGSDLLPYDFFLMLEQEKSQELFRSPENINRYRYLPQKATASNPDALPVGMVADEYLGKKYMGFTCAACHSSQANYNGVGIRIDGGAGAADMEGFMYGLAASLAETVKDDAKRQRFVAAVLKAGNYDKAEDVEADLKRYALRMEAYNFFNDSTVPYGYARLDAFGRIYNRVVEHVLNPEALREVLVGSLPPEETKKLLAKLQPVLSGQDRDHLMERLVHLLTIPQRRLLRDKVFNPANAPTSYPFLWDIPRHDYVQTNGIGGNSGVGPIGRNAGEVIGVFGTLDWARKDGWTVSSVIGGQGFGPTHTSFRSSLNVHNLRQLEDRLWTLESPLWDDAVRIAGLPAIDEQRRARGARLFELKCAKCHAGIDRKSDLRRIVAHMDSVKEAGTDPKMAENGVDYMGYSGILRNMYSNTDVGDVLLNNRAPVVLILTTATENVVATPDPDKWFFTRAAEWATTLIKEYFQNKIKPSVKTGNYVPSTTASPYESLRAYKARALNGIWATAPYLHNGSVPTLYDLLLPASPQKDDPPNTVYRPKKFMVGSRELDVKKVGFKHGESDYQGFLFDTTTLSNSNGGHEYGTRTMSDEDRWDLVEYLKSL